MKQSLITNCRFTSVWQNPKGGVVYYHELTMQNGDVGSVGTVDKLPKKIEIGTEISYEIGDDKKIKLIQSTYTPPKPTYNNNQPKMNSYAKKPDDFIGYVLGYAKDIVCAKIAAKQKVENESDEVIKISDELFKQVKKMLNE
jgi:hypothetical protein